MTITGDYRCD